MCGKLIKTGHRANRIQSYDCSPKKELSPREINTGFTKAFNDYARHDVVANVLMNARIRAAKADIHKWDMSFAVHLMVVGSLNALGEELMVEAIPMLRPARQDELDAEAKVKATMPKPKSFKGSDSKWIKKKVRDILTEQYPWYRNEVAEAVNNLNPNFFEQWGSKQFCNGESVTAGIVDKAVELLYGDVIRLRYTIKNDMDKHHVENSKLKCIVEALYLIYRSCCTMHDRMVNIGPTAPWGQCEDKDDVTDLTKVNSPHVSEYYDEAYAVRMRGARASDNLRYIETIRKAINPEGYEPSEQVWWGLKAINRQAASRSYIQSIDIEKVFSESGFEREMALINQISVYRDGTLPIDINLLGCIRAMLNGMTLRDIEKKIDRDSSITLTPELKMRWLTTIEMCRQINEGTMDIEMVNKMMEDSNNMPKGLKDKADDLRLEDLNHQSVREMLDVISATANVERQRDNEVKAAKAEADRIRKAERKAQKAERKATAEDRMIAMLAGKFGKVSKQKEKKAPEAPSRPPRGEEKKITPVADKVAEAEQTETSAMTLEIDPGSPRHHCKHWTNEEVDWLRAHWQDADFDETCTEHIGRSLQAIKVKLCRMKKQGRISPPTPIGGVLKDSI